jgi:hypothetical protein
MEKYYPFTAIVLLIMCICTVLVTYNSLKVGDSVNATVYVNKTDNSLVSIHLNKPLYIE